MNHDPEDELEFWKQVQQRLADVREQLTQDQTLFFIQHERLHWLAARLLPPRTTPLADPNKPPLDWCLTLADFMGLPKLEPQELLVTPDAAQELEQWFHK